MTPLIPLWSLPAAVLTLHLHGAGGWIVAGLLTATVVVQAMAFRHAPAVVPVEIVCLLGGK